MPIAGFKYTVQYSTLIETEANVFLVLKLAAQDFYVPTSTEKFLEICRR